ncbi:hypothetical protein ACL03H_06280 [Saccharopolyspora sp. MS10]|uniref:hypothetical protein n=1 Tax=Saccharopolyspora sp. MS10 TaxID=3385973 RepID=UPI0039A0C66C
MRFRQSHPLWTIAAAAAALPLPGAAATADPLIEAHQVTGVDLGHVEVARDLARGTAADLARDRDPLRESAADPTDRR